MNIVPQKCCTCCKQNFPANTGHFHSSKTGKYGVVAVCISCERQKSRDRYAKHGDKLRQNQREYYARNSEARIAYQIEYNHSHRDRGNSYTRKYSKCHPEIIRAANHRRRARLKGNGGIHTVDDVRKQYKSQNGKCWWCGGKLYDKYEVDHITPISRGGTNWPNNIVCACKNCNRSKSNKMPYEWNGRLV